MGPGKLSGKADEFSGGGGGNSDDLIFSRWFLSTLKFCLVHQSVKDTAYRVMRWEEQL